MGTPSVTCRVANRGTPWRAFPTATLLLLLGVQRALAESRTILLQLQLLAARLAAEDVVDVTRFIANEENDVSFLLTLGHA